MSLYVHITSYLVLRGQSRELIQPFPTDIYFCFHTINHRCYSIINQFPELISPEELFRQLFGSNGFRKLLDDRIHVYCLSGSYNHCGVYRSGGADVG